VNVVVFDAVHKARGGQPVLRGLSLVIGEGEIYGLLGPNGSGKSTAINVLCGLLEADAGRIELPAPAATMIGYCPQELALYRDLLPAENLRFFARLHGIEHDVREPRIGELMREFGLDAHAGTPVGALSGGWQRRVSIAAALVHRPRLVVLDEPSAGLDLEARHALWPVIARLREAGTAVLLTTHHLEEAERLCSRVGFIDRGRLVAEGTLAELIARVPGRMVAMIETAQRLALTERALRCGWLLREYGDRLACLLPQEQSLKAVIDALDGIEVASVSVRPVGLEQAYLDAMRGAKVERRADAATEHSALQ
jgi:ABC-2 type transport system ATP-binding protein